MFELILLILVICLLCCLPIRFNSPQPTVQPARTPSKSEIQKQLYRLVYGDQAMAERLLRQARSRHPNRSEQWIWEKVIEDLERDRGYR